MQHKEVRAWARNDGVCAPPVVAKLNENVRRAEFLCHSPNLTTGKSRLWQVG